jgi:hypothetical protein
MGQEGELSPNVGLGPAIYQGKALRPQGGLAFSAGFRHNAARSSRLACKGHARAVFYYAPKG